MDPERLKQKYASALEAVRQNNVRLDHLHVQDARLFMQAPPQTRPARAAFGMPSRRLTPLTVT